MNVERGDDGYVSRAVDISRRPRLFLNQFFKMNIVVSSNCYNDDIIDPVRWARYVDKYVHRL